MRIFPLLFIALGSMSASAQTDAGKLLEQGLKQAVAVLAPVPEKDKAAVLAPLNGKTVHGSPANPPN